MGYNNLAIKKLEEQTTNLWRVSRAWNGKSEVELTTGDAIHICVLIRDEAKPKTAVHTQNNKLLKELIQGGASPRPEESHLIEFPDTLEAQEQLG